MQDEISEMIESLDIENVALLLEDINCSMDIKAKERIKSRVFTEAGIVKPRRKLYMNKLLLVAAIAAALMLSVGAAYYSGIAQFFESYFGNRIGESLDSEELYLLERAGQMLQMQSSGEGYTVELGGLVGDGKQIYAFVQVTADDGSPMDKNYDFKRCYFYFPEDREEVIYGGGERKGKFFMPEILGEGCFMVHFEPVLEVLGEKTSLMGKEISINFQDLVQCDENGRVIEDLAYNDWEVTFTLNEDRMTMDFSVSDLMITNEGCRFEIEAIRLSPLALYIDGVLEMPFTDKLPDMNNAPFPVEIIQKDGTVINEFYQDGAGGAGLFTETTLRYEIGRSIIFRKPIDPDSVSSVKINGVEITLEKR